jgi:ABC-type transport system involved in cytochrome c biogenesis ATPase subunit
VLVEGRGGRAALLARSALLGHASATYEPLTALENLALFARLLGLPSDRRSLLARLDEVGLTAAQADAAVETFSAGMHQRLALARLLLQRPPWPCSTSPTRRSTRRACAWWTPRSSA